MLEMDKSIMRDILLRQQGVSHQSTVRVTNEFNFVYRETSFRCKLNHIKRVFKSWWPAQLKNDQNYQIMI